jgi:hypothetical protein
MNFGAEIGRLWIAATTAQVYLSSFVHRRILLHLVVLFSPVKNAFRNVQRFERLSPALFEDVFVTQYSSPSI